MINFDDCANENKTEHNKNWSYIPDKPYRIVIVGGSGSGKTNVLLNLIEKQPDTYNVTTLNRETSIYLTNFLGIFDVLILQSIIAK